jgi:hypothetical protein
MQVSAIHNNRDRISWGLLAAAALLGVFTVAKVAGFCVQRGRMQALGSLAGSAGDPNRLKQSLGTKDGRSLPEQLLSRAPEAEPVTGEGILPRRIGARHKVGQDADAKIVAIAATQVEVEDGRRRARRSHRSVLARRRRLARGHREGRARSRRRR